MRSIILPGEVRAFFFDVPIGKRAVVLDDVTTTNPGSTPDPGPLTTKKKVMMILLTRENDRLFHLPITTFPRLSCHTGRGLAGPLPGCQDGIPCGISCDARPRIRIKSRANPEYSTIFDNILDSLVGAKESTPG